MRGGKARSAKLLKTPSGRYRKGSIVYQKNIYVGIGPSIGPCCYEVGAEIISKITSNSDVYEGYMGAVISENKGFSTCGRRIRDN